MNKRQRKKRRKKEKLLITVLSNPKIVKAIIDILNNKETVLSIIVKGIKYNGKQVKHKFNTISSREVIDNIQNNERI